MTNRTIDSRVQDVLDYFEKKGTDVQVVDSNTLKLNGNTVRLDGMAKVIARHADKIFETKNLVKLMSKDPSFSFVGVRAFRTLRDNRQSATRGRLLGNKDINVGADSFQYRNLVRVVDIETADDFLFDTDREIPTRLNMEEWLSSLSKEERAMLQSDLTIRARIDYDPLSDSPYKTIDFMGQEIKSFNTYIMPEWKKVEVEGASLPSEVEKFFNHLFPCPDLREYIYNWMYTLLTNRNNCYLLLNSGMGTGKGTFVELCEHLVHRHNYYVTSEAYFQARFNYELQDRKLVFFDEVPVEGNIKNQLKFIVNDTISIERKGRDPVTKKNYASYVIANNHSFNAKLVPNDRRFSVPDITNKRLLDVFTPKELLAFKGKFNNDEFLSQVGWFILQRSWDTGAEFSSHIPWKGKRFYELCMEALPDWQKYLLNRIKKGDTEFLNIKKLKLEYEVENGAGSKFGGPSKIKSLLDEYKDESGDSFATLVKTEGKDAVRVSPKYLKVIPEEVEETEEETDDWDDFDI